MVLLTMYPVSSGGEYMKKILFSLAFALIMLTSLLPISALTDREYCTIWNYFYFSDTGFAHWTFGALSKGVEVTLEAPEQDGYRFLGWYRVTGTDANRLATAYGEKLCDTPVYRFVASVDEMSLVAAYERIETPQPAPTISA